MRAGPQRVRRGPLAGLRRRRRRAGDPADRGRRAARRGARPVRPAPAAAAAGPARRARPVRRRRAVAELLATYVDTYRRLEADQPRARRGHRLGPRAGPRGRPAALRARRDRGGRRPSPARTTSSAAEESRLGFADTLRTRRRAGPRGPVQRERRPRRAGDHLGGPRASSTASATTTPRRPSWPTGSPRSPTWSSDVAADVASYASRLDTDPARLAAVSERRAALTALTRKYGDTHRRGARLGRSRRPTRLLDLDGTDERIVALTGERDRLRGELTVAATALSKARTKAATPPGEAGHRRAGAARDAPRPPDDRGRPRSSPPPTAPTTSQLLLAANPGPSREPCTRAPPAVSSPG